MNRIEEYNALLTELETVPAETKQSISRAKARHHRRQMLWRPLGAVAAVFICFVALVNLSPTVAYACSKVPILAELAEAVSFSTSLTKAVENEYVQIVDQSKTENGVTVNIEYLIVDQKQVIIYFTLESDEYSNLKAMADPSNADGSEVLASIVSSWPNTENGELLSTAIHFGDEQNVPNQLLVEMNVYYDLPEEDSEWREIVASPEFLLEFDPTFMAKGQVVSVNEALDLGGQIIHVTTVEIYPTHIRINVEDDPNNTAWLKSMEYYLELPDGTRIDSGSASGISASGSMKENGKISYMAESSYFYDAEEIRLVVSGATFLDKDSEKVYVNLATGETDPLPFDAEYIGLDVDYSEDGRVAVFSYTTPSWMTAELFEMHYYDMEGNRYMSDRYGISAGGASSVEGQTAEQFVYLQNYPYDEVYLVPTNTDVWEPETPVSLTISTEGAVEAAQGGTRNVNQTIEVEGQKFTITTVDVYPTQVRMNIESAPENTAWLRDMTFHLELEDGTVLDEIISGVTAIQDMDTTEAVTLCAESSYFYPVDIAKVVITEAKLVDKETGRIYVNLETGEIGPAPEDFILRDIKKIGDDWQVSHWMEEPMNYRYFSGFAYDAEGKRYYMRRGETAQDETGTDCTWWDAIYLEDYDQSEVWLVVNYTDIWNGKPIEVSLQGE